MTAKKKTEKIEEKKPMGKIHPPATASSILGSTVNAAFTDAKKNIKPEWKKYYNILVDLRDTLLKQMSGLAKDSAETVPNYSLHMADSGTDNFDRDFALSLLSSDQDAIYEIEEAIKRIENGTYGICELTRKPIPKSRLDAIPWTRFTVAAQKELEKKGLIKNKRFSELGSIDLVTGTEEEETTTEENEEQSA
ncbi:MAG TPA: TraR/DksA C4-type zinc finger protein [Verrucomicrobiota bacterium]|nr:TraR/DksA C4-type zinc finger protein [Verrucomicrobiota bacterium]